MFLVALDKDFDPPRTQLSLQKSFFGCFRILNVLIWQEQKGAKREINRNNMNLVNNI